MNGHRRHFVALVVLLFVGISWLGAVDRRTEAYVDDATIEALAVFGTFRLANATISVLRSVSFDLPVVSVQLGQVLDPVDDLIEDGSEVLKFSIASLITQQLLVEIVSTSFFKFLMTAAGAFLVVSLYVGQGRFSNIFLKVFALVGLARFLFIVVVVLNGVVDQSFVEQKTRSEHERLKMASDSLADTTHLTAKNALPPEEMNIAKAQIDLLNSRKAQLLEQIGRINDQVVTARGALTSSQKKLSTLEDTLGLQKYFSDSQQLQKYKMDVEQDRRTLTAVIANLDEKRDALERVNNDLREYRARLAGETTGVFAAARAKVESLQNMLSLDGVEAKAEKMIDAILRLIALFVLKAIIIPIVFLILLLKGFRFIWGIDLQDHFHREWRRSYTEFDSTH